MTNSPVTHADAALFECALRLKFLSNYERNFLKDFQHNYSKMAGNCHLTEKQRNLLTNLANRYLAFKHLIKTGDIQNETPLISNTPTENDDDLRGDEPDPF